MQGHAAGKGQFQAGEVQATEVLVVAQGHEQGVQADEPGELVIAQVLDHRRQVARVGDQHVMVAGQHQHHAVHGKGVDVVQRQRRDHHFAALAQVGAHQCLALQHVGHQVAVGEHGALGHPGSAAGVLQHGDFAVARVGLAHRHALALGQGVGELDGLWQAVGRHHLLHVLDHGVDDQALERRQHVADFGDDDVLHAGLRQHFLGQVGHVGQAHQRLGAGVVELVFHFPRGVQRVGIDHDEAGTHGAEHHHGILQHVRQLDGDAVARLQIGVLLQPGSEATGKLVELTIGQRLAQIAERGLVGKALAGLFQNGLDVRKRIGIDLRRHACRILVLPVMFGHGKPTPKLQLVFTVGSDGWLILFGGREPGAEPLSAARVSALQKAIHSQNQASQSRQ